MLLSFWITPLWDIPDETGHFAYVRDIGSNKGIPVLGRSIIETDILSNVTGHKVERSTLNWIAQHPPAYYIPAGLVWKLAFFFTDDPEILFRAPRIISAISGSLTLVVLYFLLALFTENRIGCLGFASCVGFIPMFTHLSSGTTHDITLTLFTTLATYNWAKFLVRGKNEKFAYFAAFWLSIACFTKLTALVIVAPMISILFIELETPWRVRFKQAMIIFGIWLSLPSFWMLRSYYHYGKFLVTSANLYGGFRLENNPLQDNFYNYLTSQSGVEQFFIKISQIGQQVAIIRK